MSHHEIGGEIDQYDMVIDGESSEAATGNRFEVEFPYTRETWATVPEATPEDVDRAVSAAKNCYKSDRWQSMTATERGKLLYSLADSLEEHLDELARLSSLSNGKLLKSMQGHASILPDWFRYYAGLTDKIAGRTNPVDDERMFNFTLREPYGVVGAILSWNSSLLMALYKVAPAIAAGNTVVLKPSEIAPVTSIRLAEIADEAGWPAGALNVVTGFGEVGAALTEHDDVDKVTFTGGVGTGQAVASAAGEGIKHVTLELGGKSPNIVFPDANIENAVTGAIKGIFSATGQSCIAGSRLFLHESIEEEFMDRLLEQTESLRLGDPFDEDTDIPSLAFQEQFEKVQKYVEIAKEEGATLAIGGEPRDDLPGGLFYPPTIFTDVENDMRIAQEEVFGPVLSVITFSDEDEVVKMANDTEYGLASGVWTNDIGRGIRMSQRIEAGVVWINAYRESDIRAPFGGHKKSGIGTEKGVEVMEDFLQTKSVWVEMEGEISDPFTLM